MHLCINIFYGTTGGFSHAAGEKSITFSRMTHSDKNI
jgi:hypothetical protein